MAKNGKVLVTYVALAFLMVGTVSGMILSLQHLAETIQTFTGSSSAKAWYMAITIDVLLLGAEVSLIVLLAEPGRDWFFPFSLFILCAIMSIGLNTWAFVVHAPAQPYAMEFAFTLGIMLPLSIVLACVCTSRLMQKMVIPTIELARQGQFEDSDADEVGLTAEQLEKQREKRRQKRARRRERLRAMAQPEFATLATAQA